MKLRIKKVVNEDTPVTSATPEQTITDPSLLSQVQQLQNDKQKIQEIFNKAQEEFNKKQEDYNKQMKDIEGKLAQLMKKQEEISKNSNQQPTQQTESVKYKIIRSNKKLFEGTTKRSLLEDAITNCLSFDSDVFSYELSKDEIRRLARKINDYLSENKDKEVFWGDVRYVIKNYILKHNSISWSQSEINEFNDRLEEELNKEIYDKEFSKYF